VYDCIAPQFSARWFHDNSLETRLSSFLQQLDSNPCVLDVGSGCGRDVLAMRRAGVEAVGVDLSSEMVAEARRNVPEAVFRHMDARRLQYPPALFSGIWMCAVLLHMPDDDARQVLCEAWRVLKPGGILALTVREGEGETEDRFSRYKRLFSRGQCDRLLNETGFSVLSEHRSVCRVNTDGTQREKRWLELIARKDTPRDRNAAHDDYDSCLLCRGVRFDINRREGIAGASSVLWGNDELLVFVDIAPVVGGHMLLSTDAHYRCYGATPRTLDQAILDNMDLIDRLYRKAYGLPAVFCEHGPAFPRKAGACIAHAHMHCFPGSIKVDGMLVTKLGKGRPADLSLLRKMHSDKESYIYFGDATGHCRAFAVDVLPSQYLRQVVAATEGVADWQWQAMRAELSTRARLHETLQCLLPMADEMLLRSPPILRGVE